MSEEFHSPLAQEFRDFVAHRRAMGYSYYRAAATLKSFDRYVLARVAPNGIPPLPDLLRGWLSRRTGRKSVSVAMDLGTLRQFFRYRRRYDPDGFVPGRDWRRRPRSPSSFLTFSPKIRSMPSLRRLGASCTTAVPVPQYAC